MKKVQPKRVFELVSGNLSPEHYSALGINIASYRGHIDHWHKHLGFYELVFVLNGSARNEMTDCVEVLKPGSLRIFYPDTVHRYSAIRDFRHYNLLFVPELLQGSQWNFSVFPAAKELLAPQAPLFHLTDHDSLGATELLETLHQDFLHRGIGWQDTIFFEFGHVLSFILRHAEPEGASGHAGTWQISRTVRFMEENAEHPLTIKKLASYACMSESGFRKHFRNVTGYSPIEYLIRLRMKRALLLLMMGTRITEAAMQSGFSDNNYFSRQFRRVFACAPRDMLRKINNGKSELNVILDSLS